MRVLTLGDYTFDSLKNNKRHSFNLYEINNLVQGEKIQFKRGAFGPSIYGKLVSVEYKKDPIDAQRCEVSVKLIDYVEDQRIREELTFITSDGAKFKSDEKNKALKHQAHVNFKEWYENNRCDCVYWGNFWFWVKENKSELIKYLTELDK